MAKTDWLIIDGKGTAHIIEDVKGCDIFQGQDRPESFLTPDGIKCEPRRPTMDGIRHRHDPRSFHPDDDIVNQ